MSRDELLRRVVQRLGPQGFSDPAGLVQVVASSLCFGLAREDAKALAEALPSDLAPNPWEACGDDLELRDLCSQAAARLKVPLSHAAELVGVCLQVLAEAVGPAVAARLRRDLPPEVGSLLTPRLPPPLPRPRHDRLARSLADAQPARPLYEARPSRTQSASVASAPNPHEDTKLSTSQGLTQEREGHSLATAGRH